MAHHHLLTTRQNNLEPHEVYCAAKEIRELPELVRPLANIRLFSLCKPGVLYISRRDMSRYGSNVIYIDRQDLYISVGVSGSNLNKLKIPECGHLLDPDYTSCVNVILVFSKYSYSELLAYLFS